MIATLKKLFHFIKSILSETDGSGSASRVVKLLVAGGSIGCLVFVTWVHRELPSPDQLKALAELIGAGSAAYAVNKAAGALRKGAGGQGEAPSEDSEVS